MAFFFLSCVCLSVALIHCRVNYLVNFRWSISINPMIIWTIIVNQEWNMTIYEFELHRFNWARICCDVKQLTLIIAIIIHKQAFFVARKKSNMSQSFLELNTIKSWYTLNIDTHIIGRLKVRSITEIMMIIIIVNSSNTWWLGFTKELTVSTSDVCGASRPLVGEIDGALWLICCMVL